MALKHPGESFVRGEPLVEVETDKATVVYEAEEDGVLAEILVSRESRPRSAHRSPDWTARTGERAARSTVPSTGPPCPGRSPSLLRDLRSSRLGHAVSKPRAREPPRSREEPPPSSGSHCRISSARDGGRIRQLDVLRAGIDPEHGQRRRPEGQHDRRSLSTTGATIARRMARSRSEIPSFDVAMDVDLSAIVGLRRDVVDLVEIVPSLNDFVVKATALALHDHPAFNSSFVDGRPEHRWSRERRIAVATEDALLVPTVLDADQKALSVIAEESRDLAARARARLLPDEIAASTFTVSNSGCSTYGRSAR